ncbi:MAG TPA: GDP-mannose 4,6-dehydratase, partial [Kaistella chaponensis]|uniref:GDP-mannose 4,6-dehydratase n=1 Tax=Kaistella chaponensis TaxID=713588 RepID=UPI002BFCAA14
MAFEEVGITLEFTGENENEVGKVVECNNPKYQIEIRKVIVKVDPEYYRPTEVDLLIGDPTKAKEKLGWTATYDIAALCKEMVESDLLLD